MIILKRFKIRIRSGLAAAALVVASVAQTADSPLTAQANGGDRELPPMHVKGGSGLTFQIDVLGESAVADLPVLGPIMFDPFGGPPLFSVDLAEDVLCIQNGAQQGVQLELTDTNGRMAAYDGFAGFTYFPSTAAPVQGLTLKVTTDANPKCALIPTVAETVTTDASPVECAAADTLFAHGFEDAGGVGSGPNLQVDFRLISHPNTSTGDPAIYDIYVTNCGDAPAQPVGIKDIFPTSMAPPPSLVSFQPWDCQNGATCGGVGYINHVFSQILPGSVRVIRAERDLQAGVAGEMIRVSAAAITLNTTPDVEPSFNSGSWEFEIRDNDPPTVTVTGTADSLAEDDGTVTVTGVTIAAADTDGTITSVAVNSLNTSILTIDAVDDTDPANVLVDVTTVADAFGTATLEVIATDNLGGMSSPVTFQVAVDPVNDPPTITVRGGFDFNGGAPTFTGNCTEASPAGCANQDYPFDVGAFPANFLNWVVQVSPGPANESAQTPAVSIGPPSDPALFISAPFEPKLFDNGGTWDLDYGLSGASGTATLTITVDDGQAANNLTTLSFDIFVDNSPPTVTVTGTADNLAEDAGTVPISGATIAAADADGSITLVEVNSLTPSLLTVDSVDFTNPANVLVDITTVADAFGTATLEVVATDDVGAESSPVTFDVIVDPVNDPPSISVRGGFDYNGGTPLFASTCTEASAAGCADQDYPSDVGAYSAEYLNWVIQVSPGPANEGAQTTTVTIGAPSDPGLFIGPTFEPELFANGGTWDFNYGLDGDSGTATVLITVDDGEAVNNQVTLSLDITVASGP